jgi:hypothetical protein
MQAGGQAEPDRRFHARWEVPGTETWIGPHYEASLLNISKGGALVEHSHRVRPGTVLLLTLSVPEHKITLRCRVVRSSEHRYEVRPTGEREHVYRTGLQFLGIPEDSLLLLEKYVGSLSP